MRRHFFTATLLVSLGSTGLSGAQGLLSKASVQHAVVATSASSAAAAPGRAVTLWADVTPNRSIHIYAEGAKDFTPVSLVLAPNTAITAGRPKYPKPDVAAAPGSPDAVPAYQGPFRIALPVTLTSKAKRGDVVTVTGAVNYQACDDRLCYPVTSAPVTWNIAVD